MKKRIIHISLLVFTVAVLMTAFAAASHAYTASSSVQKQSSERVTLWSGREYKGRSRRLTVGEYPSVPIKVRSIDIPSEYVVYAYTGENFTGREYFLVDSTEKLFRYDFGRGFTVIPGIKSLKVYMTESRSIDITNLTDKAKDRIIHDYAPRIYLAVDDPYEPVSMEYVFEHFHVETDSNGSNRLVTNEEPERPFEIIDTYYGDLETAKAYAFWITGKKGSYIDIAYFQFCAMDSGKFIHLIRHMAGGHPGDWEHFTIRFLVYKSGKRTYMRPVKAAFAAHTFSENEPWEGLEMYDSTHPIVYCAYGTHGMYPHTGEYCYMDLSPVEQLVDVCTKGRPWDIWKKNRMETFELDCGKSCRALAGSPWAELFGYGEEGEPTESIETWGNKSKFPPFLNGGPAGPQHKTEMKNKNEFK